MTNLCHSRRSEFVTAVAWVTIVFGGLSAVTTFGQSLMALLIMPSAPEVAWFRAVVFVFFALSALATVAGVGLHKRREWARVLVSILFSLFAVAIVGWTVFVLSWMPTPMGTEGMAAVTHFVQVFSLVFSAGTALALGWVVKKLGSFQIRAEFLV